MSGDHEDTDGDGIADQRKVYVNPDDLSAYERIDPSWFPDYDEVDSTQIVDLGAPPDEVT